MRSKEQRRRNYQQEKSCNFDFWLPIHVVFVGVCFAGFIYQTYFIMSTYLQYNTTSVVEMKTITTLKPPDTSLCIRYVDILSQGGLTDEEKNMTSKRQRIKEIQGNVTLKEIFQYTPQAQDIISGCMHKIPASYATHVHFNRSQCLQLFGTSRFFTQEYICYRFQLRANKTKEIRGNYKYNNIVTSLQYPGMFYALLLDNETLGDANIVKIVIHERIHLPFDDLAYAQYFSRQVNNVVVYSEISAFYHKTTIQLLPPPYESECTMYKEFGGSRRACIGRCLRNLTIAKFNKVPFAFIETQQDLDYKLISALDTSNSAFGKDLDKLENDCEVVCGKKACRREMYATKVLKEGTGEFENFVIRVYVPFGPVLHVDVVPASVFQDLLVYISTSISVWLGFSVMALDPMNLWKTITWKRKVNRGDECHCEHCDKAMRALDREMDHLQRQQKRILLGYDYFSGPVSGFNGT